VQRQNVTNVIMAGVGGQGNILASKILVECARIKGLNAIVGEVFGISQRGGSVSSHVRIGDGALSPIAVEHGTQIVCGLEPLEALRSAITYVKPEGVVITNTRTYRPIRVNMGKDEYPAIEDILGALGSLCERVIAFDAIALAEKAGGAVFANMVMLGALSTVSSLDLSVRTYEDAISNSVPRLLDQNLKAFDLGRQECLLEN